MKRKVFLIEKDDDIIAMIEHLLKDEGYDIVSSTTEFGIFERIKSARPDVIILNNINAAPQATELSRALKANDEIKNIPIIALSSFLRTEILKEANAEGNPEALDIKRLNELLGA